MIFLEKRINQLKTDIGNELKKKKAKRNKPLIAIWQRSLKNNQKWLNELKKKADVEEQERIRAVIGGGFTGREILSNSIIQAEASDRIFQTMVQVDKLTKRMGDIVRQKAVVPDAHLGVLALVARDAYSAGVKIRMHQEMKNIKFTYQDS